MAEETIRTSMTKVIEDQNASIALRELALEVLHWRLRDRVRSPEQEPESLR
jgi:hypothetical protein